MSKIQKLLKKKVESQNLAEHTLRLPDHLISQVEWHEQYIGKIENLTAYASKVSAKEAELDEREKEIQAREEKLAEDGLLLLSRQKTLDTIMEGIDSYTEDCRLRARAMVAEAENQVIESSIKLNNLKDSIFVAEEELNSTTSLIEANRGVSEALEVDIVDKTDTLNRLTNEISEQSNKLIGRIAELEIEIRAKEESLKSLLDQNADFLYNLKEREARIIESERTIKIHKMRLEALYKNLGKDINLQ